MRKSGHHGQSMKTSAREHQESQVSFLLLSGITCSLVSASLCRFHSSLPGLNVLKHVLATALQNILMQTLTRETLLRALNHHAKVLVERNWFLLWILSSVCPSQESVASGSKEMDSSSSTMGRAVERGHLLQEDGCRSMGIKTVNDQFSVLCPSLCQ